MKNQRGETLVSEETVAALMARVYLRLSADTRAKLSDRMLKEVCGAFLYEFAEFGTSADADDSATFALRELANLVTTLSIPFDFRTER